MRLKLLQVVLIFLVFPCSALYSQENDKKSFSKNEIDLQILGNKGFIAVGYVRTLFVWNKISINISPAIGFVPGTHEDTLNSVPNFAHLNIGTNLVYGQLQNRVTIGGSYSKIIVGDRYHARQKSSYNRIIGELGYLRFFMKSGFAIKLSYTPLLYDDGANDVQDIPFSFTFRISI